MKIAIFSDIHSNLEALSSCCQRAKQSGVERYMCLGDSVGYGPDAGGVLDLLMSLPGITSVVGNHDESMFSLTNESYNPCIKEAANLNRKQLTGDHINFLKSLPYIHVENGATYAHASTSYPGDWDYLITEDRVKQCMDASSTNITFIGHVHIPVIYHEFPDGRIEEINPEPHKVTPLNPNRRYVVNVGSVGQPRDNNNQACFVVYDEGLNNVTYQRVPYDYLATMAKIKDSGIDGFFADRLKDGL